MAGTMAYNPGWYPQLNTDVTRNLVKSIGDYSDNKKERLSDTQSALEAFAPIAEKQTIANVLQNQYSGGKKFLKQDYQDKLNKIAKAYGTADYGKLVDYDAKGNPVVSPETLKRQDELSEQVQALTQDYLRKSGSIPSGVDSISAMGDPIKAKGALAGTLLSSGIGYDKSNKVAGTQLNDRIQAAEAAKARAAAAANSKNSLAQWVLKEKLKLGIDLMKNTTGSRRTRKGTKGSYNGYNLSGDAIANKLNIEDDSDRDKIARVTNELMNMGVPVSQGAVISALEKYLKADDIGLVGIGNKGLTGDVSIADIVEDATNLQQVLNTKRMYSGDGSYRSKQGEAIFNQALKALGGY